MNKQKTQRDQLLERGSHCEKKKKAQWNRSEPSRSRTAQFHEATGGLLLDGWVPAIDKVRPHLRQTFYILWNVGLAIGLSGAIRPHEKWTGSLKTVTPS